MANTTHQSFLNKARKDKFVLILSPPKVLIETAQDLGLNDIQLSVYGSPAPAISIPEITENYQGQSIKVTSQTREPYPPLTVNFTIDNEFKNYWFIWKWLDTMNKVEDSGMDSYFNAYTAQSKTEIVGPVTSSDDTIRKVKSDIINNKRNNKTVYPDYQTDLTMFGLDEYNNRKIEFTYTNAFVTGLGEISYNYRDTDECESEVTFAYSQFYAKLVDNC